MLSTPLKNGLGNGNITRWLASAAAAAAARRETVIATAVCMQWRRSVNIDRCWLGTASLRAAPASSAPRARISLATLPVSLSRRLAALFRCILGRIACKTWKRGQSSPLSLSATSLFRYFFLFYLRDAMLARVLALAPCLRLSATSRCSSETAERIELVFGMESSFRLSYTVLQRNSGIFKNKDTSLWNFVPYSGLQKILLWHIDRRNASWN